MPKYIVKIKGLYGEWSTISDTPHSTLMTFKEFKEYYNEQYGLEGMIELPWRMERVEKTGCSANWGGDALEDLIDSNRCGEWIKGWKGKTKLTIKQILRVYSKDGNGHPHNFDKVSRPARPPAGLGINESDKG